MIWESVAFVLDAGVVLMGAHSYRSTLSSTQIPPDTSAIVQHQLVLVDRELNWRYKFRNH